MDDFWIMRPFNALFWAVFAAFALLLAAGCLLLRGKSEKAKKAVLVVGSALTLTGFILYKYYLSLDADFRILNAEMGGFNWWGELPLHLCNINMLLLPVAVTRNSRPLMSFCFFLGPLGALMALMMPSAGFNGYSLLLPRMLGFYGTHFMVMMLGLVPAPHRTAPQGELLLRCGDGGKSRTGAVSPSAPLPLSVPDPLPEHPLPVYAAGHAALRPVGPAAEKGP